MTAVFVIVYRLNTYANNVIKILSGQTFKQLKKRLLPLATGMDRVHYCNILNTKPIGQKYQLALTLNSDMNPNDTDIIGQIT